MIFVDTGAFVGRYIERDQHHRAATAAWRQIERERSRLVTSKHVLDETFTLLGRRAGNGFAAERARSVFASRLLEIHRPGADLERSALDLFEKYADQQVTFTDCLSFALMKEGGIRRAFTFDGHFRIAGFDVWPGVV